MSKRNRTEKNKALREWRRRNPARIRPQQKASNLARKAAMRAFVNEQKSKPCMDCGGTFPPVCMDFDHRDPALKVREISMFTGGWEALKAEIAKCDLVCANCHRIRTSERKQWGPRKTANSDAPLRAQLSLLPGDDHDKAA